MSRSLAPLARKPLDRGPPFAVDLALPRAAPREGERTASARARVRARRAWYAPLRALLAAPPRPPAPGGDFWVVPVAEFLFDARRLASVAALGRTSSRWRAAARFALRAPAAEAFWRGCVATCPAAPAFGPPPSRVLLAWLESGDALAFGSEEDWLLGHVGWAAGEARTEMELAADVAEAFCLWHNIGPGPRRMASFHGTLAPWLDRGRLVVAREDGRPAAAHLLASCRRFEFAAGLRGPTWAVARGADSKVVPYAGPLRRGLLEGRRSARVSSEGGPHRCAGGVGPREGPVRSTSTQVVRRLGATVHAGLCLFLGVAAPAGDAAFSPGGYAVAPAQAARLDALLLKYALLFPPQHVAGLVPSRWNEYIVPGRHGWRFGFPPGASRPSDEDSGSDSDGSDGGSDAAWA